MSIYGDLIMEDFLTTRELANILCMAVSTIRGWRYKGEGPVFYRIGGKILYKKKDVQDFIDKFRIGVDKI